MIRTLAPRPALKEVKAEDIREQDGAELGCRGLVTQPEPGPEDSGGEGANAELFDGAVIGQRFHEYQGQARHNGRAGQG